MSYSFINKHAKRGVIFCVCLSLLILAFSAQAQDTPATEVPSETPVATETPVSDPLPTDVPTETTPVEIPPLPTQEITPAPTEITALPTEDVTLVPTEITPISTQEIVPLPTEETTAVPTSEVAPVETLTPLPTEISLPLAYSTNFDVVYPSELSAKTGWIEVAVANGKALQANLGAIPVSYTAAIFNDAAAEARFLLNTGEAQITLRGYTAGLNVDGTVTLYRNQVALVSSAATLIANQWVPVKLQVVGTSVQVSVNDALIIDYVESAPPASGTAGFSANSGAVLRVDDFAIYGVPTATTPITTETPAVGKSDVVAALPMSGPLDVPTNIILTTDITGIGVSMTWDDTTNTDQTGYEIERYVSDALSNDPNYSIIGTTAADLHLFSEANLGCGLTLWYRVRAVRSTESAVSDWSAWVSVTTDPCTAACDPSAAVRRISVGSNNTYQTSGILTTASRAFAYQNNYILFGSSNPLQSPTSELATENNLPGVSDVYIHILLDCTTSKISTTDTGAESAQAAYPGAIIYVAPALNSGFDSTDPNLTSNDGSSLSSVFISDGSNVTMVSPQLGNIKFIDMEYPYVLMTSDADLTGSYGFEDFNDMLDLILYNVETNSHQPIRDGIDMPNAGAFGGRILVAGDGTVYVVFNSLSAIGNDTNNVADIFLYNTDLHTNTRISVTDAEGQFSTASLLAGVSLVDDTLKVGFQTASRETGVAGGPTRVLVRTVSLATPNLGSTALVSRATGAAGTIAATSSYGGKLSRDGRWTVFSTSDANMVTGDTNGVADVFVRDLTSNTTKRVSFTNLGAPLTKASTLVDISEDGKAILFSTADSTVVADDTANVCETDFVDSNANVAGTQYDYNDNCEDLFVASNPLAFSATPTNLTATPLSPNKIHMTWSAVNSVQGFTIQASYDNGASWSDVATISEGNATSYDLTRTCSTTLMVRLSSYVTTPYPLTSSPSNGVTVKTTTCVGPTLQSPADKVFFTTNSVSMGWSKPDLEIYGYDIHLSTSATFATYTTLTSPTESLIASSLAEGTYYWRVRTNAPGVGAFSATRSFTVDTIAPAAPVILKPENLSVLSSSSLTLTWGAVPGTKYYKLRLNDGVYDDVYTESLTTPSYSMGSDMPQGQYTMTVTAVDAALNESATSLITFTLNPMLTPASNAAVASTAGTANVAFTWKGLASGVHTYKVELYSNASLLALVDTCVSTTVFTCTIYDVPDGVYYWRVLRDAEASNIGTAISSKFYVTSTLSVPTLKTPANNTFVMPFQRNDNVVTLLWNQSITTGTDPDYVYQVEVNTSSTFAIEPIFTMSNVTYQGVNTSALSDGTYYWRVRATNSLGAVSAWSTTFKFVLDTSAPAAPSFVNPASSALLTTARPTFTWTAPTDGAYYGFDIRTTCNSVTPLYNAFITTKSHTIPTDNFGLSQGTQQACVKVYDAGMNGGVTSSAARTFTIFLGKAPADNAFVSAATKTTFTWAETTGTTSLTLEYDTDSNFPNPTPVSVTGTSTAIQLTPGVYYWRVRRLNEIFVGNPYRTLYVGTLLAAPTQPLPASGAAYNATTTSVDLTWQDADPAPISNLDITDYELVLSKSAAFTAPISYSVSEGDEHYLWTLPAQQSRVTYYWHVRARSNGLPVSNWSATRSLIVDNFTPVAPTITSPKSLAFINTVRPTFTWGAVAGATGYRVSITDITDSTDLVPDTPVTIPSFTPAINLTQNTLKFTVIAIHNLNDGPPAELTFSVGLGTTPANNTTITTPKPSFTWKAAAGAGVKYTLEVANNVAFSNPVFTQANIAITSYTPTTPQAQALTTAGAGVYYWHVKYTGVNGTSISTAQTFTYGITGQPLNLAARVNGIAGIVDVGKVFNSTEDAPIGLTWDAPAAPAAPTGYILEIATNSAFTTGLITQNVGTDLSYEIVEGTLSDGIKYWRVKALYSADGTSAIYSATMSFTLDTVAPTQPTTSVVLSLKTTARPTLTWSSSGVGVRYRLTLYTVISSVQTVVPGYDNLLVPGTSYTPTNPLAQVSFGVYKWDVKAEDDAGNLSAGFGATLPNFQISLNNDPAYLSFTSDSTPTFTWNGVTGVGISTVNVQIATDYTMNSIVYESGNLTEPIATYTLPDDHPLTKDAIYYWRVLRSSEDPAVVYGKLFVVVTSLSSITPVLTGPVDNIVLGYPQTQTNPFTWTAITPPSFLASLGGGWGYTFETFFTPPTATSTRYRGLNTALQTSFNGGGNPDGTYYWRVRPRFGGIDGPTSGYRKFTIDSTAPSVPAMTLPVAQAVISTTRRPTFTWAASTGGAKNYIFELSNTPVFSTLLYTATFTTPTALVLPASQALSNGTYYWRVKSVDALGNVSTINLSNRSFRIAVP